MAEFQDYLNQPAFTPKAFDHIPATIAEKLGIEPKKVTNDG